MKLVLDLAKSISSLINVKVKIINFIQGRPKVKNVRGATDGFMYLDLQKLGGPQVDFVLVLGIIRGSTDLLDPPDRAPLPLKL